MKKFNNDSLRSFKSFSAEFSVDRTQTFRIHNNFFPVLKNFFIKIFSRLIWFFTSFFAFIQVQILIAPYVEECGSSCWVEIRGSQSFDIAGVASFVAMSAGLDLFLWCITPAYFRDGKKIEKEISIKIMLQKQTEKSYGWDDKKSSQ